jgi:hypothetical protein
LLTAARASEGGRVHTALFVAAVLTGVAVSQVMANNDLAIDTKPVSDVNPMNRTRKGLIPVATGPESKNGLCWGYL